MTASDGSADGGGSDGSADGGGNDGSADGGGSDGSADGGGSDGSADGGPETTVVATVLGVDVVLEEDFVSFPWRAGIKRGPVAVAIGFVLVFALSAINGFGGAVNATRLVTLGFVLYNAHTISAAVGGVPGLLQPIAEPLSGVAVWPFLRGLFVYGTEHANPPVHLADIFAGKTDEIGHFSYIERQSNPDVPLVLYYLVPVVVLFGTGVEFAISRWEDAASDSPLEMIRFGFAVAIGYVVTLLLGTVVVTILESSALTGAVLVVPDRYDLLLFGTLYPVVFVSLGALAVYLPLEVGSDESG